MDKDCKTKFLMTSTERAHHGWKSTIKMPRSLVLAILFMCRGNYPEQRSFVHAFTSSSSMVLPHRLQSSNYVESSPINFMSWQQVSSDRALCLHMTQLTDSETEIADQTLPALYPHFASILKENGFTVPTPIQRSSSIRAKGGENLLLIAATGSGKTLAYLLPTLSRICDNSNNRTKKTLLIVAPTRELAAQLARDTSLLLPDDIAGDGSMFAPVLLAVRGIPPPNPNQLARATVLVGTPDELYAVLTRVSGAQHFIAGGTLSEIILDEVDVLLPATPKTLRTSFDNSDRRERQSLEQRRKLRAAQRRGIEFHGGSDVKGKSTSVDLSSGINSQILAPTERILRLVASAQFAGQDDDRLGLQVLAGSATASRSTLDRLNKALRFASIEGGVIGMGEMTDGVWKGNVKVCRAETFDNEIVDSDEERGSPNSLVKETPHTIRAVTVPSVVDHRYVQMQKEPITNAHEVLANVARVCRQLEPESSLLFICGEFSRTITKEKQKDEPKEKGKTSQARRDAKRRRHFVEKQKETNTKVDKGGLPEPLSVRSACSILQSMEIDARPMHLALGLEPNANENVDTTLDDSNENDIKLPPVLVTFEGSARGLHFDGVDVVFVVGRPTSAASYLHLAGRVGRAVPKHAFDTNNTDVEVRPGVVVSFCTKGRITELEKWTSQVGGTRLEEITLA